MASGISRVLTTSAVYVKLNTVSLFFGKGVRPNPFKCFSLRTCTGTNKDFMAVNMTFSILAGIQY